jgi:hypothetical protein
MTQREAMIALLQAAGAGKTKHSGRTLIDHLDGTYNLLHAAGCSRDVCLAGLAHSVYGTNRFRKQTIPEEMREGVRRIIGERAEHLAYTFGRIDRPRAIEAGDGVDEADLPALSLIEAANLLEQGGSLARWPNIAALWRRQVEDSLNG